MNEVNEARSRQRRVYRGERRRLCDLTGEPSIPEISQYSPCGYLGISVTAQKNTEWKIHSVFWCGRRESAVWGRVSKARSALHYGKLIAPHDAVYRKRYVSPIRATGFAFQSLTTGFVWIEILCAWRERVQTLPRQQKEPDTKSSSFCWCGRRELNPYGKTTRPSNVRVCQFRHSRRTVGIISQLK